MESQPADTQVHANSMSDSSTVIITGASRGIGRDIALAFARGSSHSLWLIARRQKELDKTADDCLHSGAPQVLTTSCDLSKPDEVEHLSFPEELPPPYILINNAGSFLLKPLEETSRAEFEEQWRLHTLAPFLCTRKWIPMMRKAGQGLIVMIGSVGALQGQERSGAYASSKHALLGLARSFREELKGTSVAVTTILPGQTESDSWNGVEVDPEELIDPRDIGELIVTLGRLSSRTVVEEIRINPALGERSPD